MKSELEQDIVMLGVYPFYVNQAPFDQLLDSFNRNSERICRLATGFHRDNESDLPLKDIAQKIGMAHETFYRTLKALESDGKIKRNKGYVRWSC
jgi:DeoR/GlpR family transcriptional regulator of sugar metabolism